MLLPREVPGTPLPPTSTVRGARFEFSEQGLTIQVGTERVLVTEPQYLLSVARDLRWWCEQQLHPDSDSKNGDLELWVQEILRSVPPSPRGWYV